MIGTTLSVKKKYANPGFSCPTLTVRLTGNFFKFVFSLLLDDKT